jgi:hypothetical protein
MALTATRDAILTVALASCTAPIRWDTVRFANAPPVMIVDDRRDVATRPRGAPSYLELDYYDRSFQDPIVRALELRQHARALGVNALDDVPDSTWFTNRIGVRDLSPAEIGRGPVDDDGPETHTPWLVHSGKKGGTELGVVVSDARGLKYLIKFDDRSRPELETGSHVIVNRLLWAFGYNVPADQVAYVRPSDLVVAPGAGSHVDLEDVLEKAWRAPDGRIRVLASRWLAGENISGVSPIGARKDDPNDRIPHERRRDLRGQYPLFAWLDHVDLVESNFLDMWIAAPRDRSRHYVVHYKVDFGNSLGTMAASNQNIRQGQAYAFDWCDLGRSIVTLGLARSWAPPHAPALTGVSLAFVASNFDPGSWRPAIPYPPFRDADRFDMFWAAKLIAHFTRAQIHAAVEAARFSDPRATEYVTNTLVARQRATVAHWYARVNPLDRFRANPEELCFDDLAITAGLAAPGETHYEIASYDREARALGSSISAAGATGTTCVRGPRGSSGEAYTIVRLTTHRPAYAGSTLVHLARDPATGAWRVIGVVRL